MELHRQLLYEVCRLRFVLHGYFIEIISKLPSTQVKTGGINPPASPGYCPSPSRNFAKSNGDIGIHLSTSAPNICASSASPISKSNLFAGIDLIFSALCCIVSIHWALREKRELVLFSLTFFSRTNYILAKH